MALVQSFSHYNIVGQKLVSMLDLGDEIPERVCVPGIRTLSGWASLFGLQGT